MSIEQERLDKVKAQIEALDPTSQAIVEGTAAQIELACHGSPEQLALLALARVTCEVVVHLKEGTKPKAPRLIVVGGSGGVQ